MKATLSTPLPSCRRKSSRESGTRLGRIGTSAGPCRRGAPGSQRRLGLLVRLHAAEQLRNGLMRSVRREVMVSDGQELLHAPRDFSDATELAVGPQQPGQLSPAAIPAERRAAIQPPSQRSPSSASVLPAPATCIGRCASAYGSRMNRFQSALARSVMAWARRSPRIAKPIRPEPFA